MMRNILLITLSAMVLTIGGLLLPQAAVAQNFSEQACEGAGGTFTADGRCIQPAGKDFETIFKTIANTLLFIVGAVSVIMIIIGGVRYAVSGGDEQATKGAKDTIVYAVIGLVVAILAFAIINFVFKQLG